jgi:hypothetical protein
MYFSVCFLFYYLTIMYVCRRMKAAHWNAFLLRFHVFLESDRVGAFFPSTLRRFHLSTSVISGKCQTTCVKLLTDAHWSEASCGVCFRCILIIAMPRGASVMQQAPHVWPSLFLDNSVDHFERWKYTHSRILRNWLYLNAKTVEFVKVRCLRI